MEMKMTDQKEIKKNEKIKLTCPIEISGAVTEEVTMRRAKVKDMRLASANSNGSLDYESTLFANLCEIPMEAMDQIDADDYEKMQETYKSFLVSRKTH
jgi:hypothetical protein